MQQFFILEVFFYMESFLDSRSRTCSFKTNQQIDQKLKAQRVLRPSNPPTALINPTGKWMQSHSGKQMCICKDSAHTTTCYHNLLILMCFLGQIFTFSNSGDDVTKIPFSFQWLQIITSSYLKHFPNLLETVSIFTPMEGPIMERESDIWTVCSPKIGLLMRFLLSHMEAEVTTRK